MIISELQKFAVLNMGQKNGRLSQADRSTN